MRKAGLIGLEEILPRLGDDHANAQRLAGGLAAAGFEVEPVATNLVFFSAKPGEMVSEIAISNLKNRTTACQHPVYLTSVHAISRVSQGIGAPELVAAASAEGIRFLCIGGQRMRMVTHHQVSAEGVERALQVIARLVAEPEAAAAATLGAASYAGGSK